MNNMLPTMFQNFVTQNDEIHSYPTRKKDNFQQVYARTCYKKFTIKVMAPKIWNDLPQHLKVPMLFQKFKRLCKIYLSTNQH